MRQTPAHGAQGPHPHIADQPRRLRQYGAATRDGVGLLELVMTNERAERHDTVIGLDCAERQPVDIDHDARPRQPIMQNRNQTLPTRQNLRVVTVLPQQSKRFIQRLRRGIIECVHQ